jgi:Ring finger domain
MTLPSTLGQHSRHDVCFILKAMRIYELDREILRVSSHKIIDLHNFSLSVEDDSRKIFARNLLVIDLYHHDKQASSDVYQASVTRQMTLAYLASILCINCLGIAYALKSPSFYQISSSALALSFLALAVFSQAYQYNQQNIDDCLFNSYRKSFFLIPYKGKVEDPCMICFDELKKNDDLTGHLANGKVPHFFHKKCIDDMVAAARQSQRHFYDCPCCRKTVVITKVDLG